MLSKAVCVALFVAIPGFLGYPAPLNVDRREKRLCTSAVKAAARRNLASACNDRGLAAAALAHHSRRRLRTFALMTTTSSPRNCSASCGGSAAIAARSMACGPRRHCGRCKPSQIVSTLRCRSSDRIASCWLCYKVTRIKRAANPAYWVKIPAPDGRCVPGVIAGLPSRPCALTQPKRSPCITGWSAIETAALEDDIPKLPPARPVGSPGDSRDRQVGASAQVRALPRSMVATANRERPRSLPRSDQPPDVATIRTRVVAANALRIRPLTVSAH